MAKIVLGMGTSHSPQLNAPVEQWQANGIDDRNDPRVGDYDTMTGCAFAQWIVNP